MGYRVLLPMADVCCGLTWHSTGQLDMTQHVLRQTLDVLDPFLDAGYPIIGLEPSCTEMLRHESVELLPGDPRARALSELTTSFGAFVADHRTAGGVWPFRVAGAESESGQTDAVCQVHCHQKATTGYDDELAVLASLGIAVDVVGGGCCGLAGNWGFEPGHFDMSQQLAERELFPKVRAAGEDALVIADGFSCRTQIVQGTGTEARHLAEVMRDALVG